MRGRLFVHEDYAGDVIVLPGDPSQVIDPADEPALAERVGHDIVTSDGTTLWHAGIGRVGNAPITYQMDGRQFIVLGGGSALYAWALPESR